MESHRFDNLARSLAGRSSRRGILAGMAGALAAGLVPRGRASAACRPDEVYRRGMGCVCQSSGRPPESDGYCPCAEGRTRCGDVCVDTTRDAEHCGGCDLSCDDGNACTKDFCRKSRCRHEPIVCDDGFACTINGCDPAVGCVFTSDNSVCEDGVDCTVNVCDPSDPAIDSLGCAFRPDATRCDKGIACITHMCDPVGGCIDTLNDDLCPTPSNPCLKAICTKTGCIEEPIGCPPASGECIEAYCDPADGLCKERTDTRDGDACAEGDRCQENKTCLNGVCQGGNPKNCDFLDSFCSNGVCDESTGACVREPINVSEPCDDGKFCTENTTCQTNGTCGGGSSVTCNDPPECRRLPGACFEAGNGVPAGCSYLPDPDRATCDGDMGRCIGGSCIECLPEGRINCPSDFSFLCCSWSCTTDPDGPNPTCCTCL